MPLEDIRCAIRKTLDVKMMALTWKPNVIRRHFNKTYPLYVCMSSSDFGGAVQPNRCKRGHSARSLGIHLADCQCSLGILVDGSKWSANRGSIRCCKMTKISLSWPVCHWLPTSQRSMFSRSFAWGEPGTYHICYCAYIIGLGLGELQLMMADVVNHGKGTAYVKSCQLEVEAVPIVWIKPSPTTRVSSTSWVPFAFGPHSCEGVGLPMSN